MSAVKLQEIADHVGISRATVSRALRHVPGIAQDTIDKVESAARRLG
ncbi:MAG: LacI family DNA-binding transcriptional regulator [Chthoniobacterales bacterium]